MKWEHLSKDSNFALVRIPTNGETINEVELVVNLLKEFENRESEVS